MERLGLKRPVHISGIDYLGKRTWLSVSPANAGGGWHWNHDNNETTPMLPITPDLLRMGRYRNLQLHHENSRLPVIEHVLCLRYLGLDDVVIAGPTSDIGPPYITAGELWDSLWPTFTSFGDELRWITSACDASGFISDTRYTGVLSRSEVGLRATITIGYAGLGVEDRVVLLPEQEEDLLQYCYIGSQGWHPWPVVRLAWKHYQQRWLPETYARTVWPDWEHPQETLRAFAQHRFVDLLGAFATLGGTRLFGANLTSVCSGHLADLRAVRKIHEQGLVSIDSHAAVA